MCFFSRSKIWGLKDNAIPLLKGHFFFWPFTKAQSTMRQYSFDSPSFFYWISFSKIWKLTIKKASNPPFGQTIWPHFEFQVVKQILWDSKHFTSRLISEKKEPWKEMEMLFSLHFGTLVLNVLLTKLQKVPQILFTYFTERDKLQIEKKWGQPVSKL